MATPPPSPPSSPPTPSPTPPPLPPSSSPTRWAVHDLIADLQGIALSTALVRRLEGERAGGALSAVGAVLSEASAAALAVRTRGGHHLSITWRLAAVGRARDAHSQPPALPTLLPRLRLDGAPLGAVQRQASALLAAGSLGDRARRATAAVRRAHARRSWGAAASGWRAEWRRGGRLGGEGGEAEAVVIGPSDGG